MQARDPFSTSMNLDDGAVKVVMVYDSLETAKRAEGIYDRLAERLGKSFDFEQRSWRFDALEDEGFRAEAARDAADADIVIVATNDETRLPEAVQDWLEASLQHHAGAAALVALLQHFSAPVAPYLQDVARRGGMDFFAQTESESRLPKESQISLPRTSCNGHSRRAANN